VGLHSNKLTGGGGTPHEICKQDRNKTNYSQVLVSNACLPTSTSNIEYLASAATAFTQILRMK
jgi:hypothetical protein